MLSATSRAPSSSSHLSAHSAMPFTPVSARSKSPAWSALDSGSEDEAFGAQDYVLAMHDFAPQQANATCLSFAAGQVIRVFNRDASGWWDGELEGRRGWFPSNYVTSEVGLLTEEELPVGKRTRMAMEVRVVDEKQMAFYNAVRMNRVPHFQPATAFVISCVRAILSEIGCLSRDDILLKQHGILAQERKRILSDLASLVSQAKRASDETTTDDVREVEVQAMIRLAGQLFAHVRGFLAVAVQCGVELPQNAPRSDSQESQLGSSSSNLMLQDEDDFATPGKSTNGSALRRKRMPGQSTPSRHKSLGDLKTVKRVLGKDYPPVPTLNVARRKLSEQQLASPMRRTFSESTPRRHKPNQDSISSTSSSSSLSSESVGTPATPMFPSGPATTSELLDTLRYTHDNFLSTIAAFIGHAHSHSRHSHASSTGHMYDLVREVVDVVCKLLMVLESVLRHPDIPPAKTTGLLPAKENLYNVTSTLADAVRALTAPPSDDVSEEAEKEGLLRSATDTLRAGSDLTNAVKKCITRASERPLIFTIPGPGDPEGTFYTPRKFSHAGRASPVASGVRIRRADSVPAELRLAYDGEEEDMTIQPQSVGNSELTMTVPLKTPTQAEDLTIVQSSASPPTSPSPLPKDVPARADEVLPTPITPETPDPFKEEQLPPRPSFDSALRSETTSLHSYAPTEDDRTTWEGSHQRHGAPSSSFELLTSGLPPAGPASGMLPWTFPHDHSPDDVAYNSDGQLVGATLAALVERMTPHDSLVEAPFAAVFFMTFRLFTTPLDLLDAVIARYNLLPPPLSADVDLRAWQQRKGLPVRLRVSNFIKTWVETYWRHATDASILPVLTPFITDALSQMFPVPSQRILDLIQQRMIAAADAASGVGEEGPDPGLSPKPRDGGIPRTLNPPVLPPGPLSEIPQPKINKSVYAALRARNWGAVAATDFEPVELARQLTVMECTLYCGIRADESGAHLSVRAVTSLSTAITGWVAESILNEPDTKKRTALVKYFIKLADRCVGLRNYSTPRSILAALDSSTIARLHQTWNGLPQKYKILLESLRKLADHARNYHEYRSRLRNTAPPPFPSSVPEKKLINFNKYHKLARIVQDMQRFQVPYNLKEIPEVQMYLRDAFEKSSKQGDLQDLYRRSLLVEPKQSAEAPPRAATSGNLSIPRLAESSPPHVLI
ncbi:ras GEF [Epithele typhae]|uniref:ras GEF n=1 Tax=Epithele typhae TaxID=378194 RepID=UPI002007481F|nr:ras GEF [Epithele typhae]KAH9924276.1 ras GEF [Epithele typhae]